MKQLTLKESELRTAKTVEYGYQIFDGEKAIYGWHSDTNRVEAPVYLRDTPNGLVRCRAEHPDVCVEAK